MEQTMDELLNHTATWAKRRCSRKTGTTNISAERLPVPLMPDSVKRCTAAIYARWHDGRRGNGVSGHITETRQPSAGNWLFQRTHQRKPATTKLQGTFSSW